jgi:hypothetical protein
MDNTMELQQKTIELLELQMELMKSAAINKREAFAMSALNGFIQRGAYPDQAAVVHKAYMFADEMIKQGNKDK